MVATMTIKTDRLILRPMRREDAAPLHQLFGDAAFMEAFDEEAWALDQTVRWVQLNLKHQHQHGFGLFTVSLRATGEVIGDCGFERMTLEGAPVTELGYDLKRGLWGHGLATEAASAVASFGRETLRLGEIVSLVRAGNSRSQRVAEKIGMKFVRSVERAGIRYSVFALDRSS